MNIEIRHLQLVQNIVRLGSLSKCAESMNITQPAASHLLKSLEEQLGALVFNRLNKKMRLTTLGKTLLHTAEDVLPRIEECIQEIQDGLNGNRGELKISTECVTSYNWLPNLLSVFEKKHPNINLHIEVAATANPIQYLIDGKIDLAIVIDPIKNKNVSYHELFEDEILLAVGPDHPLHAKEYITAQHLKGEHYIMYTDKFENNTFVKKVLLPAGIQPEKVIKLQLTEAILEMVKAGKGVTTMSNWLLHKHLKTQALKGIRITKNGLFRKWYAAHLVQNKQNYLHNFIDELGKQSKVID